TAASGRRLRGLAGLRRPRLRGRFHQGEDERVFAFRPRAATRQQMLQSILLALGKVLVLALPEKHVAALAGGAPLAETVVAYLDVAPRIEDGAVVERAKERELVFRIDDAAHVLHERAKRALLGENRLEDFVDERLPARDECDERSEEQRPAPLTEAEQEDAEHRHERGDEQRETDEPGAKQRREQWQVRLVLGMEVLTE